jgi:hypothetical protein
MCSPIVAGTELARLLAGLPSTQKLDAALCAGRLPIDDQSRAILDKGLLSIKHGYALRNTTGTQPDRTKGFASIAQATDTLIKALQDDAGRQAAVIMEEEAVWHAPIEITRYLKELRELYETSLFYNRLYDQKYHKNIRRTEPNNWLFHKLYQVYGEIKGVDLPGIAGPLYRFTMESSKILGLKMDLSQDAYRMRIQRVLSELRKRSTLGSLASVL